MTPERRTEMLQEIAKYYGIKNNVDFAEFLGITPQTNFQRVKNGFIDYEQIYARCPDISPDWLLSGEGPMLRADRGEMIASQNTNTGGGNQSVSVVNDKNLESALEALVKEQEALAIINKYKGIERLISITKGNNYRNLQHRLNNGLKTIGMVYNPHTKKWEGEALFPNIKFYCARYSWATISAELDIPERATGFAMGHSTYKSVTSIYTRVDMKKKIDAANRAVIDYVFSK